MLPRAGRTPLPSPQHVEDWIEGADMSQTVYNSVMDSSTGGSNSWALTSTEWLSRGTHCTGDREMKEDELASWVVARARQVESMTGRLDLALLTLEYAKRAGLGASPELRECAAIVGELHGAVYDGGHWPVSLTEYEMMSDHSKFGLLLTERVGQSDLDAGKSEAVFRRTIGALRSRGIPFLRRIADGATASEGADGATASLAGADDATASSVERP